MLMQLFAKLARGSNPSTTVRLPNTMRHACATLLIVTATATCFCDTTESSEGALGAG